MMHEDDHHEADFNNEELDRPYLARVLKFANRLEYPQAIDEDICLTFDDELARKWLMLLYGMNPDEEITKEDFITLLKTRELVHNRRRDELKKKALSKIAHRVYRKFKVRTEISKTQALAIMKAYYNLDRPENQVIFNGLWGYAMKLGLRNDVVRELLTNDRLIEDFISQEALEQVLQAMHEQSRQDIQNWAVRFNQDPEGFLAYQKGTDQVAIKEKDKKPVKRGGKQLIKIPWGCQDNIQAVIEFLKTLHFRASIEPLPEMAIMLQIRIDHFSQKLILK